MKRLLLLFVAVFLLFGCEKKDSVEIWPHEQEFVSFGSSDITFYTRSRFDKIGVCMDVTDSPEHTESVENDVSVLTGEWFTVKGYMKKKTIKVHFDENVGPERILVLSVFRGSAHNEIVLIQGKPRELL